MFQHWEQMLLVVFFVRQAPALSSAPTVVTIVGNGAELLLCLGYHPWWWNLLHLFLLDPIYRSSTRPWAQGTYLLQILLHHEGRWSLAGGWSRQCPDSEEEEGQGRLQTSVFHTRCVCSKWIFLLLFSGSSYLSCCSCFSFWYFFWHLHTSGERSCSKDKEEKKDFHFLPIKI